MEPKPKKEEVLALVGRMATSQSFYRKPRSSEILRNIVNAALDGLGVTQQTLWVEVYKYEKTKLGNDMSIVREGMRNVRKAIAEFYALHPQETIRIEVPEGVYTPSITVVKAPPSSMAATPAPPPAPFSVASAQMFPPVQEPPPPPATQAARPNERKDLVWVDGEVKNLNLSIGHGRLNAGVSPETVDALKRGAGGGWRRSGGRRSC